MLILLQINQPDYTTNFVNLILSNHMRRKWDSKKCKSYILVNLILVRRVLCVLCLFFSNEVCVYIHKYMHMYVYVYMYTDVLCIFIYMYIYIIIYVCVKMYV